MKRPSSVKANVVASGAPTISPVRHASIRTLRESRDPARCMLESGQSGCGNLPAITVGVCGHCSQQLLQNSCTRPQALRHDTGYPQCMDWAEVGGLLAYGPNRLDMFRHAATYVDQILKGAKPGDLPVEQPNKFSPIINLKTAKALALTIPRSLLVRADEMIR
jgi:ABC transporter substrate binding protein